eukprot:CAMPEP_0171072034 /NCGR_PEP_ID=MMETSP0766_2-20121228/10632_1 /TAXON_ID=439317 /ORGANISM="Gambierdiscus australes, Strain CAWD 149" /LENGTH=323 /DNA_ID=CAMNT_0011528593 /DNA_START=126 /DNA_END=1097 /DNA_ORIENTATION=-
MPRLLWHTGAPTRGPLFFVAMAIYSNLIYATCFTSPLLVACLCYKAPRLCLPLLVIYVLRARARPEFRNGQPWREFARREWGFHAFRRFLDLRLHVHSALRARPAKEPVVLAVHPHGVTGEYRMFADGLLYDALPEREVLTLSATVLFYIPLVRELALWTRCVDARRQVAAAALARGKSLMVLPGGELEQIRTRAGKEEVCLSKRLGFVRLALQERAALVPCYAFGCVDLYRTYGVLEAPREWLRKRLGICIPLYRGLIGSLPKHQPVNVVMGQPFEPACAVPGSPTNEEVVAAHSAYVAALRQLFDERKAEFGYEKRQLEVV